jgi:creatinine amidohydrolase
MADRDVDDAARPGPGSGADSDADADHEDRPDPEPTLDPARHRLADHTTESAAERLADAEVALLPTGATEQHGPHLPLSTDTTAAAALARSVDRPDVVVLPPVPVGVSEHHRQFAGSLWTAPETFGAYVGDLLASIAGHGVRKAVIVNGHGGNDDALRRTARRLRRDDVTFAAPWNWWANLGDLHAELFEGPAPGHAGAAETSMVHRVRPELVRAGAVERAEAGAGDGSTPAPTGTNVDWDFADLTDSGATGRPSLWSPAAGERLFDAAREDLLTLVDWLAGTPFADLRPPESASPSADPPTDES